MNARARAFVADLRAVLDGEPRAQAVSAHAGAWLQIYVSVVDDDAVDALVVEWELDPPTRRFDGGISWYCAASVANDAAITVVGPNRKEKPSRKQP